MTDITTDCTKNKTVIGDHTFVSYVTPATAATSDTIDTHIDDVAAEGKAILRVAIQAQTGLDIAMVASSWSNTTGVITLPTIVTGVHQVFVVMGNRS